MDSSRSVAKSGTQKIFGKKQKRMKFTGNSPAFVDRSAFPAFHRVIASAEHPEWVDYDQDWSIHRASFTTRTESINLICGQSALDSDPARASYASTSVGSHSTNPGSPSNAETKLRMRPCNKFSPA